MKLVRNAVAHKFQLKVSTCNSGLSSHVRYANFPKFKFLSISQELESTSEFRNSRVWVLVNMEFIHLIAGFIFKDPAICSVHLTVAKKNKK